MKKIFEMIKNIFVKGYQFVCDSIGVWLYNGFEVFLCAVMGYAIFWIIRILLNTEISAICLTIIVYFWGGLVRPYFKEMRDYIFDKDNK